jgi:hypothetical protein
MSEEEKQKILEKHKEATKNHNNKKDEMKKGIQPPKNQDTKKPS